MNAPLAECADYDGLRKAINAVRELRNISFEQLDDLSGLPDRYSSKLFGPRPLRRIGMKSLGDILGALGVKLQLVEDLEALAKVEKRFVARDEAHLKSVHSGAVNVQINRGFLRKIGVIGGSNSRKNMTKAKARKLAKKAIRTRWNKRKAIEIRKRARQRIAAHKARKNGND